MEGSGSAIEQWSAEQERDRAGHERHDSDEDESGQQAATEWDGGLDPYGAGSALDLGPASSSHVVGETLHRLGHRGAALDRARHRPSEAAQVRVVLKK